MERHRQHGGAHATRGLGVPEEEQPLIIKQRVEGRHQPALEPLEQLGDRRLGELLRLKQQRYAHGDLRVEPLHVAHVAELRSSAALREHQAMRLPLKLAHGRQRRHGQRVERLEEVAALLAR